MLIPQIPIGLRYLGSYTFFGTALSLYSEKILMVVSGSLYTTFC